MTGRGTRVSALALSVLGLLVSAYLTYEHFTAASTFACPENATLNCVKVTTSEYAVVLGAPVAVLGLVFFVVMTALTLPFAWDRGVALDRVRLGASAVGVVSALYLVWVELFRVDAICLWCTAVHVISVALFAVLAVHLALRPGPPAEIRA